MSHEHAAIEEILGALDRSVNSGPARMEFRISFGPSGLAASAPLLYRPVLRLLEKRTKPETLPEWLAVGFVDFEAQRCIWRNPGRPEQATLIVGDRRWDGRVGAPLATLSDKPAVGPQNPLWLIDILRGVIRGQAKGDEPLNGHACRRLEAHVNLGRAAELVHYDMAVSKRNLIWTDLDQIPVDVWVEKRQGCIRRVGVAGDKGALISRMDLLDFGIELPADWSCLWLPPER